MVKGVKREYIHPNFTSQKTLKREIGDALAKEAKKYGLNYKQYTKEHKFFIPGIVKDINSKRAGTAKHNTSEFFISLYSHIFGGEIKSSKTKLWQGFNPDITKETEESIVHTEVKSVARKRGAPYVSCFQFMNYCEDFLRLAVNGQPNCGVDYAFFRYGSTQVNEKLYNKDLEGLTKRVSESVFDLVVMPLNILIPFLAYHESTGLNHESSSGRDVEYYWQPLGRNFTKINKIPGAMEEFFKDFEEKEISKDVLYLDEVFREESMSPDNLFCRRYKIKPFKIIKYTNKDMSTWAKSFTENYYSLFEALDLDADSFEEIVQKHLLKDSSKNQDIGDVPF